jgi:hypothetical protein
MSIYMSPLGVMVVSPRVIFYFGEGGGDGGATTPTVSAGGISVVSFLPQEEIRTVRESSRIKCFMS